MPLFLLEDSFAMSFISEVDPYVEMLPQSLINFALRKVVYIGEGRRGAKDKGEERSNEALRISRRLDSLVANTFLTS